MYVFDKMESSCLDQRGGLCQGLVGAGLLPLREDEQEQRLVARQEQARAAQFHSSQRGEQGGPGGSSQD